MGEKLPDFSKKTAYDRFHRGIHPDVIVYILSTLIATVVVGGGAILVAAVVMRIS